MFTLAEEMRKVELTGLDESATRTLTKAKKRFEDARREATRAFKNEALTSVYQRNKLSISGAELGKASWQGLIKAEAGRSFLVSAT